MSPPPLPPFSVYRLIQSHISRAVERKDGGVERGGVSQGAQQTSRVIGKRKARQPSATPTAKQINDEDAPECVVVDVLSSSSSSSSSLYTFGRLGATHDVWLGKGGAPIVLGLYRGGDWDGRGLADSRWSS